MNEATESARWRPQRLTAGDLGTVVRRSVLAWFDDDAPSMGAAIAFYTLFAIAPILLIFIWLAGMFIKADVVQDHILAQLQAILGSDSADAVRRLLLSSRYRADSGLSTTVEIGAVLIGATSVFAELQNALHRIWRTPPRSVVQGLWHAVRARLLSVGLVLGIGFLLLVSLIASTALEGFGSWLGTFISDWQILVLALDALLGWAIAALLFAVIFKYVPRQRIDWRDARLGGIVTSSLFTGGKWVIVVYLGKIAVSSAYGVAGSILVLMLWVYYSAQIFLLGAEFTREFAAARLRGRRAPGTGDASTGTAT